MSCIDKRCDECLDWSQDEMEAYVKHRKSLVSKDKKGKDSLPKPRSSPGPVQSSSPSVSLSVSNVDSRISSRLSEISTSFDHKLEALQAFLMSNISSMRSLDPVSMSARLSPNVLLHLHRRYLFWVPYLDRKHLPTTLKVLSALTESFMRLG